MKWRSKAEYQKCAVVGCHNEMNPAHTVEVTILNHGLLIVTSGKICDKCYARIQTDELVKSKQ